MRVVLKGDSLRGSADVNGLTEAGKGGYFTRLILSSFHPGQVKQDRLEAGFP